MLDHHYYPDFDRRHNYVVVASGTNFADALAGSYLASGLDCPILLVNNKYVDTVKEYIRSNVKPGATVYLLGGQAAVPKNMETGLDGYNVVRLGGANRYETNLKILAEGSKHGGTIHRVFICTGKSFADSLSVSSSGQPILLVKDKLTEDQISYLQSISAEIVIIGGKNAVNNTIEQQLTSIGTVSRIAGSNRYETSYLVAQQVPYDRPYRLCVASGKNFPDGLCGGPLAYDWGGALILTDPGKESYVTKYVADAGVTDGYVLGGKKALPDDTLFTVFECVKYNRAGLIDGEEG